MNAAPMVARCFRHQHPEAYGRGDVDPVYCTDTDAERRVRRDDAPVGSNAEGYVAPEDRGLTGAAPLAAEPSWEAG